MSDARRHSPPRSNSPAADDDSKPSKTLAADSHKVYKAISRVHRACNACRKQKARCDGPEHPPCRRCRTSGIECVFEKPPAQPSSSDTGIERIKSLESQMATMQSMIGDLVATIKANTHALGSKHISSSVAASASASASPPNRFHATASMEHSTSHYPNTINGPTPSYNHHQPALSPNAMIQIPPQSRPRYSKMHAPGPQPVNLLQPVPDPSHPGTLSDHNQAQFQNWARESPQSMNGGSTPARWNSSHLAHSQPGPSTADFARTTSGSVWNTSTAMSTLGDTPNETASQSSTASVDAHRQSWRSEMPSDAAMPPPATRSHSKRRNANNETDIPNDQLSAPIEALRGLADAAAAAAMDEERPSSADSSSGEHEEQHQSQQQQPPPPPPPPPSSQQHHQHQQDGDVQGAERTSNRSINQNRTNDKGTPSTSALIGPASVKTEHMAPSPLTDLNGPPRKRRRGTTVSTTDAGAKRDKFVDGFDDLGCDKEGDLVTLGLVSMDEAERVFRIFGQGVPKFISIFDFDEEHFADRLQDLMQSIRSRSPFLFNVILAIGAKIECGGQPPTRLYNVCMSNARRCAKDTLFLPVECKETVQAMVLMAAYCDNGWLPTGLSIRMAQEIGLDKVFQKLMTTIAPGSHSRLPPPPVPPKQSIYRQGSPHSLHSASPGDLCDLNPQRMSEQPRGTRFEDDELRELASGARIWFFLFLFDHQASFGAGRPAMLSKHYVRNARAFLTLPHPLSIKTDARFVSTLELLIIRETHYDAMAPYDQPVDGRMLSRMRRVTHELNEWHQYWSEELARRSYGDESFFQQSLILQCASAELYLTCTALRGIRDAQDANQMGPEQKELIIQATRAADTCLSISVNGDEYRRMLGWGPHYTHVTAAFACVFLIKIARLFPRQVDTYGIFSNAEKLAARLAEVPATKYARVIRILLAQAWKKITELSPTIGLYAALGADGARAGAITPAEIRPNGSMGPSDSGISLLYKLLQEHQDSEPAASAASHPPLWTAAQTPVTPSRSTVDWNATEPLHLPIWMQESTGIPGIDALPTQPAVVATTPANQPSSTFDHVCE